MSEKHSFLYTPTKTVYVLLLILATFLLYLVTRTYTERITIYGDEQLALFAAVLFVGGIFIGRALSGIWILKLRQIPRDHWVILPVIMAGCVVAVFIAAEFPLHDRVALNLLLFGFPYLIFSICLGIIVKHLRTVVRQEIRDVRATAEQREGELRALQSQISPHFLFNTLNNLYGLSITDHEKLPPLLLRLSDLLRYSVYEAKDLYVPLNEELNYIRHYIEFEKLRIGDRLQLDMTIEDTFPPEARIAPMLLIVFVENAFKHSKNTTDAIIRIDLTMRSWGKSLLFSVKNSRQTAENEDTNGGVGLENVRRRLGLLYPGKYDLTIAEEEHSYLVLLQLPV